VFPKATLKVFTNALFDSSRVKNSEQEISSRGGFRSGGVLSAWAFNSYAAWFEKLYNAVPSQ
jgi:hypothetical protein